MDSQAKIRASVLGRAIPYLLHFTPTENLGNIAALGIQPRRMLQRTHYRPSAGDRLDGRSDVVSVSVTRLNMWMFAAKRKSSGIRDWTVLMLAPSILWTHRCRFCWTNAASNEVSRKGFLEGPWAFDEMFRRSTPGSHALPAAFPTHDDAEVQVLGSIAPDLITSAVVDRNYKAGAARRALAGSPLKDLPIIVEEFASF